MPLAPPDFRQRTRFVIKLGRALHDCGSTSERIERHLTNVTSMLGLKGSFLVSPTTFTCAFWEDDELDQFVHIERVEPADYNLGRLWEIDHLVESMELGKTKFADGLDELKRLSESPPCYSLPVDAFSWLLTGGCFATLLSANPFNAIVSALISVLIFLVVRQTSRHPSWKQVATIIGAMAAGLLASGIAAAGLPSNPPLVVLSSIIIFIPGLALTVSLTEISAGHLISGCSRLVDAVMTLLKLFFGAVSGIALTRLYFDAVPQIFGSMGSLSEMPSWRVWPALIGLALSLGVGLNIPRRRVSWGILAVFIAFTSATLGERWFGMYAGVFLGALAVGLYSNLFSRLTRGPGSVLLIYGVIVLVPGSKVYSILNHWVSGETILPSQSGSTALMAFVSLTAGLLFSNAFLPARKSL
ncbi:MAG: threonine/serine exporter family protein [Akkermansiaceae bacterium]|jgi:uncharacterized membrane protein YjjP (DUF1212 family)|nr:threonine/serine exporter family protein [Akkermansiaceae bacterium]